MIFSTRDDVYCIDGHKFMNKFVALREESHKSDIEYRKKFAKSKDRVRNMGQQQIGIFLIFIYIYYNLFIKLIYLFVY